MIVNHHDVAANTFYSTSKKVGYKILIFAK